jgi:hypothetical protein
VQRNALYERRSNNNDKQERQLLTNENANELVFETFVLFLSYLK